MKKIKFLFPVALSTLLFVGCGPKNEQAGSESTAATADVEVKEEKLKDLVEETGWKVYKKDNYQMLYNNNWTVDDSYNATTKFQMYLNQIDEQHPFQANINLVTENVPGSMATLDKYVSAAEKQLKLAYANITIADSKTVTDDKYGEHQEIVSDLDYSGIKMKIKQNIFVKDKTAYILTYVSADGDYETYLPEVQKAFISFTAN